MKVIRKTKEGAIVLLSPKEDNISGDKEFEVLITWEQIRKLMRKKAECIVQNEIVKDINKN